jgi:hypothetical protein
MSNDRLKSVSITNRQASGMRGVYLVAAELSRLGYTVAVTARNAAGADVMVFSARTAEARSIDVKTNAKYANFWLVGKRAKEISSRSHFYVFVNISTREGTEVFDYFVVPSKVVREKTELGKSKIGMMYFFRLRDAEAFHSKWNLLLGAP